MPKKSGQKLRLIYLIEILKKHSDEEHPLNATQIAEKLLEYDIEAERKTVYDDLSALEDAGYDIIKTTTPKKGWFMGDREFEVPEIYLLSDVVRSAKIISPKKTREILAKLNSMLSSHQVKKRENAVYFGAVDKTDNEMLYYNIDRISYAIENSLQIRITYASRSFDDDRQIKKKPRLVTVNPYALTWKDDHYYLIGNHPKYDNLMHLRLDRMSDVEFTGDEYKHFSEVSPYKDYFDTQDYVKKLFGMHTGDVTELEFRANRKISEQVFDRFSQNIFIKNLTEDEFSFSVNAVISDALVTWIMNYGTDLRVLKPQSLIDMITKRANEVLSNYDTGEN